MKQAVQLWILIISLFFLCVSTLMIFENRFRLLNFKNVKWMRFQPFWLFLNVLFCFLLLLPTMLQIPDQDVARQMVFDTLPCIPEFLYSTEIIVPSLNPILIIVPTLVFIIVIFGQLLTFTVIVIRQLSSDFGASVLSENSRRLQKSFLKALIWQSGIPILYFVIPACVSMVTIGMGIFSRPLNNILVAVTSLHGAVSTLSMIFIHKPYRNTVFYWFTQRRQDTTRIVEIQPVYSTNTPIGPYVAN
uniref:Serpentine Receptor, class H n=1 Tax=Caenorhabditis tropicalis TaxID=1561998 RepID=A0A1I7T4W4_9PELO